MFYADYSFQCETVADVPIRIDHDNLQRLLFNAFLSDWLKRFTDFPLYVENIESVRLIKGRSGIFLDNKEHVILEHCINSDGSKLIATSLDIMLLLDVEHFKAAKAHRSKSDAQLEDEDMVCLRFMTLFLCSQPFCSLVLDPTPKQIRLF